jgi:hypothetical protein
MRICEASPSLVPAWWAAALADADLTKWKPSNSELDDSTIS